MVNFCAGFGVLLSVAAVVLIVFGEIGQINSSIIPRHLRIVSLSTDGLGAAIAAATNNNLNGSLADLYSTSNSYSDRGGNANGTAGTGLRKTYEWGLWNYCATNGGVGSPRSYCTGSAFGSAFQPAISIMQDVPTKYEAALNRVLPDTVFTADDYLGRFTKVATYLVFIGAILSALAMLIGFIAHRFAYVLAALLAALGALTLAVGLVIYTVIFSRIIAAINDVKVAGVSLGVSLTYGNGLWILWAATGCMVLAVLPYSIACCTGRRDRKTAAT